MAGGGAGGATVVGGSTLGCVVVGDVSGGRSGSGVLGRTGSFGSFGSEDMGLSSSIFPSGRDVVVVDGRVVVVVDGWVVVVVPGGNVAGGRGGGGGATGGIVTPGGSGGAGGTGTETGGTPGISGCAGWRSHTYRANSVRPSLRRSTRTCSIGTGRSVFLMAGTASPRGTIRRVSYASVRSWTSILSMAS